jgi:hypothetical protein
MKIPQPIIPKMKYAGGGKRMMSLRLPKNLMSRLKEISARNGWSTTMLIQLVLDQYAQHEDKEGDI